MDGFGHGASCDRVAITETLLRTRPTGADTIVGGGAGELSLARRRAFDPPRICETARIDRLTASRSVLKGTMWQSNSNGTII